MARVTVEEAAKKVGGNYFNLVLIAAARARQICNGDKPRIEFDESKKHKSTIIALLEIEAGKTTKKLIDLYEMLQEVAVEKAQTEIINAIIEGPY